MSGLLFGRFCLPASVLKTLGKHAIVDLSGVVICSVPYEDKSSRQTAERLCALINETPRTQPM